MSDEARIYDPDADYLCDEDRAPPSLFDVLAEVACGVAETLKVEIRIEIDEPEDGREGISMGIAKEVQIRLLEKAAALFEADEPTRGDLAMARKYRDKARRLRTFGSRWGGLQGTEDA